MEKNAIFFSHSQGDQIGRIFAHWVIFFFGQFLKMTFLGYFKPKVKVMLKWVGLPFGRFFSQTHMVTLLTVFLVYAKITGLIDKNWQKSPKIVIITLTPGGNRAEAQHGRGHGGGVRRRGGHGPHHDRGAGVRRTEVHGRHDAEGGVPQAAGIDFMKLRFGRKVFGQIFFP
jgi:hypothetical protein